MPDQQDAASLLRTVGLLADGPAAWARPVHHTGPGVFLIELTTPRPTAHLDLALIGKWLERVPELRLDGQRPTSRDLQHRLEAFWLPSQVVLFVGSTGGSVAARISGIARTIPGDRRPASSGYWLHFLRELRDLRVWWAATDAVEEYEDAVLDAFAESVPAADARKLPDPAVILPWATLRSPSGARKPTGVTNPLLPEIRAPEPPPVSRVVDLPPAEADGASDEARRARRPVQGRGSGRVASAAASAARGSPRAAPEPIYLSPDGHARLEAELEDLVTQRPEVIRRIATAREHGDLSENAEYHAAREEQSFLEGRIRTLEARLKIAVVVAPTERGARVELGSRVRVEVDGEESVVQVVSSAEASAAAGRISSASPVGAALMGRRVGDVVTIRTPGGEIRYAVLGIE